MLRVLTVVDPEGRAVALHLYDGVIKGGGWRTEGAGIGEGGLERREEGQLHYTLRTEY